MICIYLAAMIACLLIPGIYSIHHIDTSLFSPNSYPEGSVVRRDVAVIGGGSSGTYAAINLRLQGQSVAVVEREDELGGHVNTYKDPSTGETVNYGVQGWWNITVVRDFFAHFDISLALYPSGPERPVVYDDFRTGTTLNVNTSTNYSRYLAQQRKYPYLAYSWDIPKPVPVDLITPFGDFVEKYSLQDVAYNIYYAAQGLSNVLSELTVNVFKIVDDAFVAVVQGHGVSTADNNNHQLYEKALVELGSDALLSSTVVAAHRPHNGTGVRLIVQGPGGKKLILASKLLVSIPLLVDEMRPFDLDEREYNIFKQWQYSAYYTMLINGTGLTKGARYNNAVADLAVYNIPTLPAAYQITETRIDGLYLVWYGSATPLEENVVKANVTSVIKSIRATQNSSISSDPEFVAFRSHTPFKLVVSAESLQQGFYDDLSALQGYRRTWYTGAAVLSHNSALLWNFTAALIPDIIAA